MVRRRTMRRDKMSENEIDSSMKKINDTHFDGSFVALKQTHAHTHTRNRSLRWAYFLSRPKQQLENESQTTQSMQTKLLKHMKSCQTQQITTNMCLALLHTNTLVFWSAWLSFSRCSQIATRHIPGNNSFEIESFFPIRPKVSLFISQHSPYSCFRSQYGVVWFHFHCFSFPIFCVFVWQKRKDVHFHNWIHLYVCNVQ